QSAGFLSFGKEYAPKRRYTYAERPIQPMTPTRVRRYGVALLAGAAGVALNLLPLPAVARLFPGRIVTLPMAMLYGPWHGAIAGIIAALPLARSLPLVIIVFALEALLVGAFARRSKPTLVA